MHVMEGLARAILEELCPSPLNVRQRHAASTLRGPPGYLNAERDAQAYDQVVNAPHKAELSHELLAGAASFEAMKAYERHCAANGQPTSHAEAKELLAGFAGAFVDRMVETKGLDYVDRQKAKRHAHEQTVEVVNEENYNVY
ncbi:uncharacterized protein FIBRA_03635 [Fibroporia radiculosa]|uniref:Uncharacterized protein n=1 Tax=Fibroporia radiculosa TaxID=599839 RepID=J4GNL0_9APHY|nr:uncharacterized protein FIBRA_03635 [Fibroporia radiculosa]CCM01575.1 predicted protein [Fibroporia radiculosa]